jgi:hypothetical protein
LQLFVIGLNDQVYTQTLDQSGGSLSGYNLTTDGMVKALTVGTTVNNAPELFVVGLNDQVYTQQFDSIGNPITGYQLLTPGVVETLQVTKRI